MDSRFLNTWETIIDINKLRPKLKALYKYNNGLKPPINSIFDEFHQCNLSDLRVVLLCNNSLEVIIDSLKTYNINITINELLKSGILILKDKLINMNTIINKEFIKSLLVKLSLKYSGILYVVPDNLSYLRNYINTSYNRVFTIKDYTSEYIINDRLIPYYVFKVINNYMYKQFRFNLNG